jgi:hypothetical protein
VAPLTGGARAARWLAIAVALLYLGFPVGLVVLFSDPAGTLLKGDVGGLRAILALPVLAALLTLALVWFTIVAWRKGLWGRWGRVHYTALTLGALAVTLVLGYWNLLGWHF